MSAKLPIHSALPALKRALAGHNAAVLTAPPGSGKTTVAPLALLAEPWLAGRKLLMLEPRRLAARAAAARMAWLRGEAVGDSVGYRVRLDSRVSARTRIEVLTEGLLTRRVQNDPELSGVGLVIFDEFHERNLQGDLALALCREVQQGLREDLRLLVMSATLDGVAESIAALLGGAPVVTAAGRQHAVDRVYLDRDPGRDGIVRATVSAVLRALRESDGDLLVFLPGAREIRQAATQLAAAVPGGVVVRPLYGDLGRAAQQQALCVDSDGRRRVVLATDIAESSLTIDGVRVVIDSGLARRPQFDPGNGLTRLVTRRVSRASATQRAGRAGRVAAGVCYRLWSRATQSGLVGSEVPELLQADLAALLLELLVWGCVEPGELAWLDPPPAAALVQARTLLNALGALDAAGRPSPRGRQMAALPLHPRLAHMLLKGREHGALELACRVAALVSERDILIRGGSGARSRVGADLDLRLQLLEAFADQELGVDGRRTAVDRAACRQVLQLARQWRGLLQQARSGRVRKAHPLSTGALLAWAWPDRVARRSAADPRRYRLANGRAALLDEEDPLQTQDWLVVADLDAGRGDGRVFLAAGVELDALRGQLGSHITRHELVEWAPREQAVRCGSEERLGRLSLGFVAAEQPDPDAVQAAMLAGVRSLGIAALPWTPKARSLQLRVATARQWRPDDGWPELSDEHLEQTLEQWLGPWLGGITRRSQLSRLDLTAALEACLDWPRQRALERLLPTHIRVPSGSRVALEYRADGPPILAVRIQELFGQAETPAVCENRIPVVLHLLSPARRPIQVTRDLAGFWAHTYAQVRKELKGRYPKHYWPDDPGTAMATAGVRPRL